MLVRLITFDQRGVLLPWPNATDVHRHMHTQHWITPEELRDLGQQTRTAWQSFGVVRERRQDSEATEWRVWRSL